MQLLIQQSSIDPDRIFPAPKACDLEEMFASVKKPTVSVAELHARAASTATTSTSTSASTATSSSSVSVKPKPKPSTAVADPKKRPAGK